MLSKAELIELFEGRIRPQSIVKRNGGGDEDEWVVFGKYCIAAYDDDGRLDVWLCSPANIRDGLAPVRVHRIMAEIASRTGVEVANWRVLDGEAYTKSMTPAQVVACADLLGIRLKRRMPAGGWNTPPAKHRFGASDGPAIQP